MWCLLIGRVQPIISIDPRGLAVGTYNHPFIIKYSWGYILVYIGIIEFGVRYTLGHICIIGCGVRYTLYNKILCKVSIYKLEYNEILLRVQSYNHVWCKTVHVWLLQKKMMGFLPSRRLKIPWNDGVVLYWYRNIDLNLCTQD